MTRRLPWLETSSKSSYDFPPLETALTYPNGLLAAGGDLSPERILAAYQRGIFPWYSEGEPILWWSPNPRAVLIPHELHLSKSLQKKLRKHYFKISFDHCFSEVMRACAEPRAYADGTWISEEIIAGYSALHAQGKAHSVEVWEMRDQTWELVGGLYGVALGKIFFGESMFARATDASKIGFAYLVRQLIAWDFKLIDCQVPNEHTSSLGARELPREEFLQYLLDFANAPTQYPSNWSAVNPEPWQS